VVFILFYLDLKIYSNGFEKKGKKITCCASGGLKARSGRPALLSLADGPKPPSPLFLHPRGLAQLGSREPFPCWSR
jgi:hypothetical protein